MTVVPAGNSTPPSVVATRVKRKSLDQMARALPQLVAAIAPLLEGQVADPEAVAMTLVRVSVCHYLVPGYDDDRLLDQLRVAAGVR